MSTSKELCLKLLKANSEDEVVKLLRDAGYWDNPDVWRFYGDRDGNYSIIGNQSAYPEAALVEKLVNCVDSRLMNECLVKGIDPASPEAPQSIRQAVARFFENRESDVELGGKIQEWSTSRRTEEAQNITLAATGSKKTPCLTICDNGEGQTPNAIPETFLSLTKSNKLRIKFVQGKYNQGGSGAVKYCGSQGLQLVISRRNPAIVDAMGEEDDSAELWGFTVVRRERPTDQVGDVKSSVYTFLAPGGSKDSPKQGEVLRFAADALLLMPQYEQPYSRDLKWGSAIKLYDYDMKAFPSHILMKDGLLFRLETRLTEVSLPISLHECRDFRGKSKQSFVTTLSGLTVRLEEGKGGNLEEGFPDSVPFEVNGEKMVAKIYAFAKNKAKTYRKNEGVIFTVNGQTHGHLPKSIFSRPARVKLGRLAESLLVTVDCSDISPDAIEDLFMTSRDRLSSGELRRAVERQLEDILCHHEALKKLQNRRQSEEVEERLADSKPLEDILSEILKTSKTLAALLQRGQRLSRPHSLDLSGGGNGNNGQSGNNGQRNDVPFIGTPHPSFFRFHKKPAGHALTRNCEVDRRCRIKFETDVENGYFKRTSLPGLYDVEIVDGACAGQNINSSLTLHDGIANWSIELPEDVQAGNKLTLQCTISDDTLQDPFTNLTTISVLEKSDPPPGLPGKRIRRGDSNERGGEGTANNEGVDGDGEGANGEGTNPKPGVAQPSGLAMPDIRRVKRDGWSKYDFDENSACKMIEDTADDGTSKYTFYVNVDNICLRTELKYAEHDVGLVEARFVYGQVLVALALLQDHKRDSSKPPENESGEASDFEQTIEDKIAVTTKALSPFIIPMITYLGSLEASDITEGAETGDDD